METQHFTRIELTFHQANFSIYVTLTTFLTKVLTLFRFVAYMDKQKLSTQHFDLRTMTFHSYLLSYFQ